MQTSTALTSGDYRNLSDRWIDMFWADQAQLKRYASLDAGELIGRNGAKQRLDGVAIPYRDPETTHRVTYRLRLDNPGTVVSGSGREKPKNKYLSPPGDRVHIYFPPGISMAHLANAELPLIITEGEFKGLALRRLASFQQSTDTLRFVPVALAGVWAWRGKIGVRPGPEIGSVDQIHGPIPDWSKINLVGRKVIIAFDADAKTNGFIQAARFGLREMLMAHGAQVANLEWDGRPDIDGKPAKGIDDWLARDKHEVVLGAISRVEFKSGLDWESQLLRTDNGKPKGLLENARRALEGSTEWRGTLTYDTFLGVVNATRKPWGEPLGGPWTDEDNIHLSCWMQSKGIEVGKDIAMDAVQVAARRKNCAQEYLQSLEWDGEARLDYWLIRYMGARTMRGERDITNYVTAVGAAWLIGGVARIMDPGCQMDYCLVLVGKEGINKSSAFRVMGGEWFSDSLRDIQSQFAPTSLKGRSIIEFSDLEAWGRSEANMLKAFISRRADFFRKPFGRISEEIPRTCIFGGSTNDDSFLKDIAAEDRRMWPVECRPMAGRFTVDLDALIHDRDQLWAEAYSRYMDGARPYLQDQLTIHMAGEERGHYRATDPWVQIISKYLEEKRPMIGFPDEIPLSAAELLTGPLKEYSKASQADGIRCANILKSMGYMTCTYGKGLRGWRKI